MTDTIENKDMIEAIDRIAMTDDGALLYLYLQKTLCGVSGAGTEERALSRLEGKRSFAAELMALMAEGIRNSGRSSNRPVTFAVSGSRRIGSGQHDGGSRFDPGPGQRRVSANTYVSGWDQRSGADGTDGDPPI